MENNFTLLAVLILANIGAKLVSGFFINKDTSTVRAAWITFASWLAVAPSSVLFYFIFAGNQSNEAYLYLISLLSLFAIGRSVFSSWGQAMTCTGCGHTFIESEVECSNCGEPVNNYDTSTLSGKFKERTGPFIVMLGLTAFLFYALLK